MIELLLMLLILPGLPFAILLMKITKKRNIHNTDIAFTAGYFGAAIWIGVIGLIVWNLFF